MSKNQTSLKEPTAVQDQSGEMRPPETMRSLIWKRFRRHPGAVAGSIVFIILLIAITAAGFSPYDPEESDIINRYLPPSWEHPFGTDPIGRDMLTRVLYGGRISLVVGLMVVLITLVIGVPIGALAGYFGGWVDNLLMRFTDAVLSFPSLLVLILLTSILRETELPFLSRNNVVTIALVIGILSWMGVARLVRASFLSLREKEFVLAANCIGTPTLRVMARHILPNAMGPVIVESTLTVAWAIMEESGLSFLGFGIMPPTPSWGNLLSNAQEHMSRHPWLAVFPGLMIFVTIISINYIGDGLRDALDPYKVLTGSGES
jgi:peptide/nickel transport system permease protein